MVGTHDEDRSTTLWARGSKEGSVLSRYHFNKTLKPTEPVTDEDNVLSSVKLTTEWNPSGLKLKVGSGMGPRAHPLR